MNVLEKPGSLPMRTKFARAVMTGVVAVSLSAVGIAPATAVADTGSVTVTAIEGNESNTYKVYQLFTADIDASDNATHVKWNAAAKSTVLAFLDSKEYGEWLSLKGYTSADDHDEAKRAAEFISERVRNSPTDRDAQTVPPSKKAGTFASDLAGILATSNLAAETATVGSAYTNSEGYYLLVTNPASLSGNEAGTSPIWLALGGSISEITEKSAIPSVEKKVKGAGDASWSYATDAFRGQDIDFELRGTLPSNIKAFKTYHYKLTDTLSGLEPLGSDESSVRVLVGGSDVTAKLVGASGSITYDSNTLTVDIANLLALENIDIDKNTSIVVQYKAHTTNSPDGTAGNVGSNSVNLTYTADPVSDAEVTTDDKTVKVFSYKANVIKVDQANGQALEGAKFTVQVATYSGDTTLVGKYVQADGSLGSNPYKFTSGADGTFSIPGLDAGTYTIKETDAPDGYKVQSADITFTVSSTVDGAQATFGNLQGTVTGGEAHADGENATAVTGVDGTDGEIALQIVDAKQFQLANTGLEGLSAYLAIAAALASAGGIALVVSRRREGTEA